MADHVRDSAARTAVVAQIEDEEALSNMEAIASTTGIDCLFVGRMDLTISMGAYSPLDARVVEAVELICQTGRRHGKAVGMFIPQGEDCAIWQQKGASLFLLGSDQQLLLDGARLLCTKITPME